jgi:hypothetical protein
MSALNFKPSAEPSPAVETTVAVPALDAGANDASMSRQGEMARQQRRRSAATRLQFEDEGFRLFRIY